MQSPVHALAGCGLSAAELFSSRCFLKLRRGGSSEHSTSACNLTRRAVAPAQLRLPGGTWLGSAPGQAALRFQRGAGLPAGTPQLPRAVRCLRVAGPPGARGLRLCTWPSGLFRAKFSARRNCGSGSGGPARAPLSKCDTALSSCVSATGKWVRCPDLQVDAAVSSTDAEFRAESLRN
jgi:hypothetical protein